MVSQIKKLRQYSPSIKDENFYYFFLAIKDRMVYFCMSENMEG